MPGLNEQYHREGLREGSPAPLSYWPAITTAISPSHPIVAVWDTQLRPKIESVLEGHGIIYRSLSPLKRKDIFWPSSRSDETVFIDVPAQYYRDDNWCLATLELRTFFASIGFSDLIVEIVDAASFMRHTWPIELSDPVIQEWPQIRNLLTEQLNMDEAVCLESINVFRRGSSTDKSKSVVTVILTASELYGLRTIQSRIREQLDINGYSHIDLELIRDRVIRFATSNVRCLEYRRLQLNLGASTLGLSVGVKGVEESGTLGASVSLQNANGQMINLGLTCYHVVRPGLTEMQRHGTFSNSPYASTKDSSC
jgi:hypothetical protein